MICVLPAESEEGHRGIRGVLHRGCGFGHMGSSNRGVDPEQMIHGVLVGLGRSSSRVADFDYSDSSAEFPHPAQSCCTDRPQATIMDTSTSSTSKDHHHPCNNNNSNNNRSFFQSCFTKSSSKAASKFPNWPKSPSHIMSRLLLTPDMSPDRILSMKSPSAGDQSPARSKSRFTRSSNKIKHSSSHFFSGPLIPRKKNSFEEDDKDEPTSPKVTCMGTVKAPKNAQNSQKKPDKKNKKSKDGKSRPPVDPKVKKSIEQQTQSSVILDLSRFGGHSGELRPGKSSYGKSLLQDENAHQQARKQFSLADCKKPMRILVQQEQQQQDCNFKQQLQKQDWNSLKQQQRQLENKCFDDFKRELRTIAVIPRSKSDGSAMKSAEFGPNPAALKRPEEICLWKRRCIPEPLRLDVAAHKAQLKN